MAHRGEAAKLNGFDISHFDRLQLYALAAGHAHVQFLRAAVPPDPFTTLSEVATKLRDRMYQDLVALAHRDLIRAQHVTVFKGNRGYRNMAFDLLGMSQLLRQEWEKVVSKSGVQLSELDQAQLIAQQLIAAVRAREEALSAMADAQAQRKRNFTLFSRSYDQVRRAITFMRWDHEDADKICPSLFAGRGGRGKKR